LTFKDCGAHRSHLTEHRYTCYQVRRVSFGGWLAIVLFALRCFSESCICGVSRSLDKNFFFRLFPFSFYTVFCESGPPTNGKLGSLAFACYFFSLACSRWGGKKFSYTARGWHYLAGVLFFDMALRWKGSVFHTVELRYDMGRMEMGRLCRFLCN